VSPHVLSDTVIAFVTY